MNENTREGNIHLMLWSDLLQNVTSPLLCRETCVWLVISWIFCWIQRFDFVSWVWDLIIFVQYVQYRRVRNSLSIRCWRFSRVDIWTKYFSNTHTYINKWFVFTLPSSSLFETKHSGREAKGFCYLNVLLREILWCGAHHHHHGKGQSSSSNNQKCNFSSDSNLIYREENNKRSLLYITTKYWRRDDEDNNDSTYFH